MAGGKSVRFIPQLTGTPIDLSIFAVWPELDLVLLRPRDRNALTNIGMEPAALAKSSPVPGGEVTSIGYPTGLGYSITRGVVSGIRVFKDLPAEFQQGLDRSPDSRWVQTDCAINPGNSGGPLFNLNFEIVGINTWASVRHNDIYFALASTDIRLALSKHPTGTLKIVVGSEDPSDPTSIPPTNSGISRVYKQISYGPADDEGECYLELSTTPNTDVWINGVMVGSTSSAAEKLLISDLPHDLVVRLERNGYCPESHRPHIPPTGYKKVSFAVTHPLPLQNRLTVTAFPGESILSLSGPVTGTKLVESGSFEFENLPSGTYRIRIKHGSSVLEKEIQLEQTDIKYVTANMVAKTIEVRESAPPVYCLVIDKGILNRVGFNRHMHAPQTFYFDGSTDEWSRGGQCSINKTEPEDPMWRYLLENPQSNIRVLSVDERVPKPNPRHLASSISTEWMRRHSGWVIGELPKDPKVVKAIHRFLDGGLLSETGIPLRDGHPAKVLILTSGTAQHLWLDNTGRAQRQQRRRR